MFKPAALHRARPQNRTAYVKSYPAPTGGWNTRDALASMPPTDAVSVINWWMRTTDCVVRKGADEHVTGIPLPTQSLVTYNALSGTNKMFGVTAGGVYDVSSPGAVGASVATVTNGYWQSVNMGDGSNYYLIMVNGVDKPLYYNGTTWVAVDGASSPALTGITTTNLIHVNVFQDRLFFIEKNSLSVWYLAAGTVGGALTEFSFEGKAKRGGYLMAMATWTVDGGDGSNDLAVFITSQGEFFVYQGTNPSSVATWSLIGNYYIAPPIGRRCFAKYGGDIVVVTRTGVYPLSKALLSSTIDKRVALTDKIDSAFAEAARVYGSVQGWEPFIYPPEQMLLINIPTSALVTAKQYPMNTLTKAWTQFNGWNANCFCFFNNEMYFGGATTVVKAYTGTSDFDTNVVAYCKTAFNYFGQAQLEKRMNLWRPVFRIDGNLVFLTGMNVDYSDDAILGDGTYSVLDGAIWDTDTWDNGIWGTDLAVKQEWQTVVCNMGRCFASLLQISNNTLQIEWIANDYAYDVGGVL